MIKAIVFDCFGVLVGKGFKNTYTLAGGDPYKDHDFISGMLFKANYGLISDDEFHSVMSEHLGIPEQKWRDVVDEAELPNKELLSYIGNLHASYKTAILSNFSDKKLLFHKIGEDWLNSCFDEIVVSAEVGMAKPDPEIYKLVSDRLKVSPEECIFIDDHQEYLDAGSKLGMQVILYENFNTFKQDLEKLLA